MKTSQVQAKKADGALAWGSAGEAMAEGGCGDEGEETKGTGRNRAPKGLRTKGDSSGQIVSVAREKARPLVSPEME